MEAAEAGHRNTATQRNDDNTATVAIQMSLFAERSKFVRSTFKASTVRCSAVRSL